MGEELIFGPPGCGKTYTLIDIVKEELGRGTPPDRIGFVSFSKKSIEEAKDRISAQTKLSFKDVPWFKTLHSTGYNWLGLNESNMMTRNDFNDLGKELGVVFDGYLDIERIDLNTRLYFIQATVIVESYMFILQIMDNDKTSLNANRNLFNLMANSVVFPDQYNY